MTIDVARAPRGELVAAALVEEVVRGDDRLERHYLELKGPLDLRSRQDSAKIAKFILGAANRPHEVSDGYFEGCAVMIIGVAHGRAVGVPPIEAMDISRALERYIGAAGVAPRWDLVRVPADSSPNEVLVVVVDPRDESHPPYLCYANGDGLVDGAIYMRADGETRNATAAEVQVLISRSAQGAHPRADFAIAIEYAPRPIALDSDAAVDAYVEGVRDLFTTEQARAGFQLGSPLTSVMGFAQLPEERTQAQFLAEIDAWEAEIRRQIRSSVEPLASGLLDAVTVTVINRSETYFHDVEVQIHLEGEIRAAAYEHATSYSDLAINLPPLPRRWGPRQNPALARIGMMNVPVENLFDPQALVPPRTTWSNGGSVNLTLDVGDIRPLATARVDDEEFVLFLPSENGASVVRGTWSLTARDHHKVYSGELELAVGEVADFTPIVREYLARRMPQPKDNETS